MVNMDILRVSPCQLSIPPQTLMKAKQRDNPTLHGLRQREVPGTVNEIPVDAIPDYGSSVDVISETFARKHGLEIRAADRGSIQLPGGGVAEIVGTRSGPS